MPQYFDNNSFRSLASKGFPDGYSTGGCVCVSAFIGSSEPTRWFSQMTPDEHPRRHRLADGPLSWPTLITLSTLTNFELVWRRLCDDVLFRSSCIFYPTQLANRSFDEILD